MEQVHGGDLQSYLQKTVVSEADMVEIMRQLITGIGYLHESGIIHRDLKPENILIETISPDEFRIKITDFGLSKLGSPAELIFDCCGTPAYVAPEVLHKTGYRSQVDLWACGIILYSMISKTFPFQSKDRKQTFLQIKQMEPDFSNPAFEVEVSQACVNFIKRLLEKDPVKRISVDDALKHEFFHNTATKQKKSAHASTALVEGDRDAQTKFVDYVSNPALAAQIAAEQSKLNAEILDANVPEIKPGRRTVFIRRDDEDSDPEVDQKDIEVLDDYGAYNTQTAAGSTVV